MHNRELSAADVIALLKLQPHPEGGHFRETFRDVRPRYRHREQKRIRARCLDRDLLPARRRRDLALAPRRCGRGLALVCRRAARVVARRRERRRHPSRTRPGTRVQASARKRSSPPAAGNRQRASARGRSLAAPWRRDSSLRVLSSRTRALTRQIPRCCRNVNAPMWLDGRTRDFSTTNALGSDSLTHWRQTLIVQFTDAQRHCACRIGATHQRVLASTY